MVKYIKHFKDPRGLLPIILSYYYRTLHIIILINGDKMILKCLSILLESLIIYVHACIFICDQLLLMTFDVNILQRFNREDFQKTLLG